MTYAPLTESVTSAVATAPHRHRHATYATGRWWGVRPTSKDAATQALSRLHTQSENPQVRRQFLGLFRGVSAGGTGSKRVDTAQFASSFLSNVEFSSRCQRTLVDIIIHKLATFRPTRGIGPRPLSGHKDET